MCDREGGGGSIKQWGTLKALQRWSGREREGERHPSQILLGPVKEMELGQWGKRRAQRRLEKEWRVGWSVSVSGAQACRRRSHQQRRCRVSHTSRKSRRSLPWHRRRVLSRMKHHRECSRRGSSCDEQSHRRRASHHRTINNLGLRQRVRQRETETETDREGQRERQETRQRDRGQARSITHL
jgi:hypothetical protein